MRWAVLFLASASALTAGSLPRGAALHAPRVATPCCAVTAARAARNPKPHWQQNRAQNVEWPTWPEISSKTSDFDALLQSFVTVTSTVPLRASAEPNGDWRAWSDGGFTAVKVVAAKLNRNTYSAVLACLRELVVRSQARYPDLYAVLKFVPKKNGLNPLMAQLEDWDPEQPCCRDECPTDLVLEGLKAREVRRRLDDLQRAFEQSWLLSSTYLTLPSKALREDFLWSARTVVEKIKTDQRSRALELLCLGVFHRDAALHARVSSGKFTIRKGFEKNFGVEVWHPKPTNARMIWQRCRMVYPFLEVAYRSWRDSTGRPLGSPTHSDEEHEADAAAIASLLDRIARAGPEEKVLNSLLYWLIDLAYKSMLQGETFTPWTPEPYVLRRGGVEERLLGEMRTVGHLLHLVQDCESKELEGCPALADELLVEVKAVVATSTLLASIRGSCMEACPEVLHTYDEALRDREMSLGMLEQLEYDAMGALLGLNGTYVAAHKHTVRRAMQEWRNPELLFRYLDDNKGDPRMEALITRWLRSIFGLSSETLTEIRRESPENLRHLSVIPQETLLRWYSPHCPGTSLCKTLFMVGEDAGSCLRIISNEGSRYNKALMGYVLQSHVRALVITDTVGRVLCRSIVRLLLRSDTLTPIVFCDPMFFTLGYSEELQRELLLQARELERIMQVPVVHAGSVLPVLDGGELSAGVCFPPDREAPEGSFEAAQEVADAFSFSGYVRRQQKLDYDVIWVDLLEMDGVAPYTYSEELPYDDLLRQHSPGVQERSAEKTELTIAALPRADSPSAARYVKEREGETAWTMHLKDGEKFDRGLLPNQVVAQLGQRQHADLQFDPSKTQLDTVTDLPATPFKGPSLNE